jgi:hypothetical protein
MNGLCITHISLVSFTDRLASTFFSETSSAISFSDHKPLFYAGASAVRRHHDAVDALNYFLAISIERSKHAETQNGKNHAGAAGPDIGYW